MSVYKPKNRPFYYFDFEINGHRFHGSTKKGSERDARAVEELERKAALAEIERERVNGGIPRQLDLIGGKYWMERGQYLSSAREVEHGIDLLIKFFGPNRSIDTITDNDVAKLVAWRRQHRVVRSNKPKEWPLVKAATVNHTSETLQRLFKYAKELGARFDQEPTWKNHRLKQPRERVRELNGDEGDRITAATRDDYGPFFAFVRATGLRQAECVTLRWSEVNFEAGVIVRAGKNDQTVTTPITDMVRDILEPLRGHHPEFVFTYVAQRTSRRWGVVRGRRYPLRTANVKQVWKRIRAKAGVTDFRFHDFRHDVGTKLLRETGNLKLVQQALNHRDVRSTLRYAHVLDADVRAAMQTLHTKSRQKSRHQTPKND